MPYETVRTVAALFIIVVGLLGTIAYIWFSQATKITKLERSNKRIGNIKQAKIDGLKARHDRLVKLLQRKARDQTKLRLEIAELREGRNHMAHRKGKRVIEL